MHNKFDDITEQIKDTRERIAAHITPEERRRLDRKLELLLAQRDALTKGHDLYEGRDLGTDMREDR